MRVIAYGLLREALGREYGRELLDGLEASARVGRAQGVDLPSDALACWLGRQAVDLAAASHPTLFAKPEGLRGFLQGLVAGVPSGRLLSTDGDGELVDILPDPDGGLLISVRAPGGPCAFVKGVVVAAAEYYDQSVSVRRLKCLRRGDNRCVLALSVRSPASLLHEPEPRRRLRLA